MRIDASSVARIVSGTLVGNEAVADGIWFDTRTLVPGQAFVAIRADRDGHEHLEAARAAGAPFALVERGRSRAGLACVEVDDTMVALAALGAHCRERLTEPCAGRIVGITGSAGKTSTKQLVGAVLAAGFPGAVASAASLNNDIGVPVTIACAPESTPAIVLEMGMRGFGEIARLCALARPVIGIVTNVGDAHSARVGGRDGVARAKSELVQALPPSGTAILNADDPRVSAMAALTEARTLTFGAGPAADVRWGVLSRDRDGRATARFDHGGSSADGLVPLIGDHMVANAAAAVAAGLACGMSLHDCVGALMGAKEISGRGSWHAVGGIRILDDSYNANSTSMTAALAVLAGAGAGALFAVLGEMAELDEPEGAHRMVAEGAAELGVQLLPLETAMYGPPAMSVDEIVEVVRNAGSCSVLVKGSRAARTERVVEALLGR